MAKGKRGKKRKVSPNSTREISAAPEQNPPADIPDPEEPAIQDEPLPATAVFHRFDWIAGCLAPLISFGV